MAGGCFGVWWGAVGASYYVKCLGMIRARGWPYTGHTSYFYRNLIVGKMCGEILFDEYTARAHHQTDSSSLDLSLFTGGQDCCLREHNRFWGEEVSLQ